MTPPVSHPAAAKPGLRWYQFSLRSCLLLTFFISLGLSLPTAYFRKARLDDAVRYADCTCGLARARISNGEVVLLEPNHAKPAGTVVATIETEDGICTIRRIRKDGSLGAAESCEVDHLGAKFYDERFGSFVYVLMADNWKLYPFAFFVRVRSMFR
jgi:hypothetical protein